MSFSELKKLIMKRCVKAFTTEGTEIAEIYSIKRDGNRLVLDGKALGVMRMDFIITQEEFLKVLRMMWCRDVISFILLLPYFTLKRWLDRSQEGN